jgi:hypothetical protein
MTFEDAQAYVRDNGVVLVSAKGPVPRMTDAIVGEPVYGSWWAHPKGREIYRLLQALDNSPDIVTCRLIGGKVTLVHRRLWPALIRAAPRFAPRALARTGQEHTASGRHLRRDIAFPDWCDAQSLAAAEALTEDEALDALGPWSRG